MMRILMFAYREKERERAGDVLKNEKCFQRKKHRKNRKKNFISNLTCRIKENLQSNKWIIVIMIEANQQQQQKNQSSSFIIIEAKERKKDNKKN